jgi:hypothetical protein
MVYNSLNETLINLWSIVHIIVLKLNNAKGMHVKWCNQSKTLCTRNPCFPLCNYIFIRSIWWKNKLYQSFETLKQRATREMIALLNHLASFLYSLCSKFLTLNACHMCKKKSCKQKCLVDF